MTTTDTPTTLRVVRREPEVFEAENVAPDGYPNNWYIATPDRVDGYYSDDLLDATFIDADQAADEAWNRVVNELVDQFRYSAAICKMSGMTTTVEEFLRAAELVEAQLRPTPSEGVSHE